jgi:hypothetical protein
MLKIAISLHVQYQNRQCMLGLIKHFYEYGKHTATTKFNEIESKFSYSG